MISKHSMFGDLNIGKEDIIYYAFKKNYGSISISKLQDGKNALSVNINAPTQF